MIQDPEPGVYFEADVNEWSKWKLRHGSLRKPQFVIYACTWTKIIWQDAMMEKEDAEGNCDCSVPKELHSVWCTRTCYDGQEALCFAWNQLQEHDFLVGDRFVLSRSSVEVDGDFK